MNARFVGGIVTIVALGVLWFFVTTRSSSSTPVSAPVRVVSDVAEDGTEYAVQHTFLCLLPNGREARDWHFTDRWVKNQLSYDMYEVGGKTVTAIRQVASMPLGSVRFVRRTIGLSGPSLEGHDYLKTRIDGRIARIELDKLFVEHNVQLEAQARPLPTCGTPRS